MFATDSSQSYQYGGRIRVRNASLLNGPDFTVEMFVKIVVDRVASSLAGKTVGVSPNLMSWSLQTGVRGELQLRVDNYNASTDTGQKALIIGSAADAPIIGDHKWHHVGVTYDSVNLTVTLYVDYEIVGQATLSSPILWDGSDFHIGEVMGGRAIGAYIDEPRFSNAVLNASDFLRATRMAVNAADFDRHGFNKECYAAVIKATGNLAGWSRTQNPDPSDCDVDPAIAGFVEYDLTVGHSGWYELTYQHLAFDIGQPYKYGFRHEYLVDGIALNGIGVEKASEWQQAGDWMKVSNVWLEPGAHTVRIARNTCCFHPITQIKLAPTPVDPPLRNRVRVQYAGDRMFGRRFVRAGGALQLNIFGSNLGSLSVEVIDGKPPYAAGVRTSLNLPSSAIPATYAGTVSVPNQEGAYFLRFYDGNEAISSRDVRWLPFNVIDATPPQTNGEPNQTLVTTIDCRTNSGTPESTIFYQDSLNSSRITTALGGYRESGDVGYRQSIGNSSAQPSWFAYALPNMEKDRLYRIEIDYPDDAWRSFAISIREAPPKTYYLTSGVDSGREYRLTNSAQTHSMLFWSRRAQAPRLAFINAQTTSRAACQSIRVYALETDELPPLAVPPGDRRHFGYYFEEVGNWDSVFGVDSTDAMSSYQAADRWARTMKYFGGDTLFVPAQVYGKTLYPSRDYHRSITTSYQDDLLEMLLLVAEKHGLRVIAEVHPRPDELNWPADVLDSTKENLTVAYNGSVGRKAPGGMGPDGIRMGSSTEQPQFSLTHPTNRAWLRGMVSELASRYETYSTFHGIALRTMFFMNAGLNNFHSLLWGYDDYSIRLFALETGNQDLSSLPYESRYDALAKPGAPLRGDWLHWRSYKVAELYRELLSDTQTAVPNRQGLRIYSDIFASDMFPVSEPDSAGIAPDRLLSTENLVPINALYEWGRASRAASLSASITEDQTVRDYLVDPAVLNMFAGETNTAGETPAILFKANYTDYTGVLISPEAIGQTDSAPVNTNGHLHPSGRSDLERYALAVAETDALSLFNGGNAYYIDQPIVREFMQEYRSLPAIRFNRRREDTDPVAIWTLNSDAYYFYLVNREPYPVSVALTFSDVPEVHRLAPPNLEVPHSDRTVTLELEPFQLRAYYAQSGITIDSTSFNIATEDRAWTENRIAWLEGLYQSVLADTNSRGLTSGQVSTLQQYSLDARDQLNEGHLWRSRMLTEHHDLQSIYFQLEDIPPY